MLSKIKLVILDRVRHLMNIPGHCGTALSQYPDHFIYAGSQWMNSYKLLLYKDYTIDYRGSFEIQYPAIYE